MASKTSLTSTRWTLIKRLKNWDDQEGWREFFDTYWKLIYGIATKAGLTHAESQEVVQETVIAVCRNIKDFETDSKAGSFKSWLLQMSRWRIMDQIRKRSVLRDDSPKQDDSETSTTNRIPDPAGLDLERVWEEEWRENLIQAALERIQRQTSAKHYQVFYLYVIRDTPVENVAKIAGVSTNEVYLVKHRLKPLFEEALRAVEKHR